MSNEPAITAKRMTLALCAAGVIGGAVGAIAVNHNNVAAEVAPAAHRASVMRLAVMAGSLDMYELLMKMSMVWMIDGASFPHEP